jgi:hypothetical protein
VWGYFYGLAGLIGGAGLLLYRFKILGPQSAKRQDKKLLLEITSVFKNGKCTFEY